MLHEVPPQARTLLSPLFADCPGLHGLVHAVLSGEMGTAAADDLPSPKVALLHLDFYVVGGRPEPAGFEEVLLALPATGSLVVPDAWHEPLQQRCGANLTPHRRVEFQAGEWDRRALRRFIETLPEGYKLKRVSEADVGEFRRLTSSLVYNYPSLEDFLARRVGFGIEHEGRFVSGCSSFSLGGGEVEFEIDTHPDFFRRGFATAAAAGLIEYCLENGLEPCWDAHNEASARLATKLGFINPRPYTSYIVHPVLIS